MVNKLFVCVTLSPLCMNLSFPYEKAFQKKPPPSQFFSYTLLLVYDFLPSFSLVVCRWFSILIRLPSLVSVISVTSLPQEVNRASPLRHFLFPFCFSSPSQALPPILFPLFFRVKFAAPPFPFFFCEPLLFRVPELGFSLLTVEAEDSYLFYCVLLFFEYRAPSGPFTSSFSCNPILSPNFPPLILSLHSRNLPLFMRKKSPESFYFRDLRLNPSGVGSFFFFDVSGSLSAFSISKFPPFLSVPPFDLFPPLSPTLDLSLRKFSKFRVCFSVLSSVGPCRFFFHPFFSTREQFSPSPCGPFFVVPPDLRFRLSPLLLLEMKPFPFFENTKKSSLLYRFRSAPFPLFPSLKRYDL